jgi:hypothetical protein
MLWSINTELSRSPQIRRLSDFEHERLQVDTDRILGEASKSPGLFLFSLFNSEKKGTKIASIWTEWLHD